LPKEAVFFGAYLCKWEQNFIFFAVACQQKMAFGFSVFLSPKNGNGKSQKATKRKVEQAFSIIKTGRQISENQSLIPIKGYFKDIIPRHTNREFVIALNKQAFRLFNVIFCHYFQLLFG
jgi:hypothetical protein